MRTYDDTFSGQKIYPGKVRLHHHQHTEGYCKRRVARNIVVARENMQVCHEQILRR